jgi:hypothetical protein
MSARTVAKPDCNDKNEPLRSEIDPELQKLLFSYPGKWVAITSSRLVAVGDDVREVIQKAAAEGEESPIIYRVPRAVGAFFF